MAALSPGSTGPQVAALQQQLRQRGFDPGQFDGSFGPSTDTAVRAFQQSVGLEPDGPNTIAALKMPSVTSNVTAENVSPMFPGAPRVNIQFHLPFVLNSLLNAGLADKSMAMMAFGTIRAETASFLPIDEGNRETLSPC